MKTLKVHYNYFNSNMVRLKEYLGMKEKTKNVYFNSNMVRLKATGKRLGTFCTNVFQFQYGSIKSEQIPSCIHEFRISIPIWFD